MLVDGITSIGGYAEKLTITNGATLPTTDLRVGQLFFKTGADTGLYVYRSTGWSLLLTLAGTTDNVVYLDAAQTITNKTLTTPTLTKPQVNGIVEKRVALPGTSIDVGAGAIFTKTLSGVTTFSVTGAPAAGNVASFILKLTNGGNYAVTWWNGVKWSGGAAPVLTANGKDNIGFYTDDGGATWEGFLLSKDSK